MFWYSEPTKSCPKSVQISRNLEKKAGCNAHFHWCGWSPLRIKLIAYDTLRWFWRSLWKPLVSCGLESGPSRYCYSWISKLCNGFDWCVHTETKRNDKTTSVSPSHRSFTHSPKFTSFFFKRNHENFTICFILRPILKVNSELLWTWLKATS